MKPLLLGLLLLLFQSAAHGVDQHARDAEFAVLIASFQRGSSDRGMNEKDQLLADRFHAHGPATIPYLLPLLESKKEHLRNFAGYVLRDQTGLTEQHLPALIKGYQRGSEWLPPAIGRIGTPAAIEFLIADLKARPQTSTQVTYAMELVGEPAVPYLVALLDTRVTASKDLSQVLCQILSELKSERAAELLLNTASGRKAGLTNRLYAVENIGCMGSRAQRVIPGLQKLAAAEPAKFGPAVSAAIMRIGSAQSVPYFVEALRADASMITFASLAALGNDAITAGPVLVEFLVKPDPEVRLGAARALGLIGHRPAAHHLLPLLAEPDDWRLAFAAAESLGRLRAQQAIPALDQLASRHWYPPVRDAARFAIKVIRGDATHPLPKHDSPMAFYEFNTPGTVAVRPLGTRPSFVNATHALTPGALEKLKYHIRSPTERRGDRRARSATISPGTGMKVPEGYLVGRDSGEFGGELVYLSEKSSATILLKQNTRAIYRMPFGILAVTGLAHLGLNDGALFLVMPVESGGYTARRWKTLPGAPGVSGMLDNGKLFIATLGGDVVISPEGTIEMAVNRPATDGREAP